MFRNWVVAIHGALIALPVFLAFLHLVLFASNRRARENVFYAAEMLAFGSRTTLRSSSSA